MSVEGVSRPSKGNARHGGKAQASANTIVGDMAWESMLRQLAHYKLLHGHCFVPLRCPENPKLGAWLAEQIEQFKKRRLLPSRQRALEGLGLEWDFGDSRATRKGPEGRWEERFAELVAFQKQHGHLRVTLSNQTSPGFMHWRDNQRINLRAGTLTPQRKARLDAIGFEWESPGRLPVHHMEAQNVALWNHMFAQLRDYKQAHGHCQVPTGWKDNPVLAKWVLRQRGHNNQNRLSPDRKARLEQIGFAWKSDKLPFKDAWEVRFAELVAFQQQHGHLRVTKSNQSSPGFMHWRDNQRINQRAGTLKPERKARLDAIGFEWESPGRLPVHHMEDYNVALWDRMFAQLRDFKQAHGHCQVPTGWKDNPVLAKWVGRQRGHNNRGHLPPDRKARLEQLGFAWKSDKLPFKDAWERRFAELVAFQQRHGHLAITMTNQSSPGFAHWRDNQRIFLRQGKLAPERKAQLDAIGFEWQAPAQPPRLAPSARLHVSTTEWEQGFARLVAFERENGHTDVPAPWLEDPALALWVKQQRIAHEYRRLSRAQIARLDALGFPWALDSEVRWQARHAELAAFHSQQGHCHPSHHATETRALAEWLAGQRKAWRERRMPPARLKQLEAINWQQPPPVIEQPAKPTTWDIRFAELKAFLQSHGHTRIPQTKAEFKTLRSWVTSQRVYRRKGSLNPWCREQLDAIGFDWKPSAAPPRPVTQRPAKPTTWDIRFGELKTFLQSHGHTRIPKNKADLKKLRSWVTAQRVYRRKDTLNPSHREQLDAMGFEWNPSAVRQATSPQAPITAIWKQRYQQLLDFKTRHGHTRVPVHRGEDKKLGGWVVAQRVYHRQGRLKEDRVRRLDEIGFVWNPPNSKVGNPSDTSGIPSSDARFAELLAFHAQHGHANVPTKYPANPLLGNWVSNARISYKKGQFSPARIQQLEALGFAWAVGRTESLNRSFWERRFAELLDFKAHTGHTNVPSTYQPNPSLATWVIAQRFKHRTGTLSETEAKRLGALGFQWFRRQREPGRNRPWAQRYADLLAYRQQHGHPHVSRTDPACQALATWVLGQRVMYHDGKLRPEQIDQLNAIGFAWVGLDGQWERSLLQWQVATQQLGQTHLGKVNGKHRIPSQWETAQRLQHRHGQLSLARFQKLDALGFVWVLPGSGQT